MRMIALIPVFALVACNSPEIAEREFFVADAPGENASFLIERKSGCVWALVVERGELGHRRDSTSLEQGRQDHELLGRLFDDAKKSGRFELIDVKSTRTESCRRIFGLTSETMGSK